MHDSVFSPFFFFLKIDWSDSCYILYCWSISRGHGFAPLAKISVGWAVPVVTVQAHLRVTVSVVAAAPVGWVWWGLLPGCSHAALFFHLQLAVIWPLEGAAELFPPSVPVAGEHSPSLIVQTRLLPVFSAGFTFAVMFCSDVKICLDEILWFYFIVVFFRFT